LITVSFASLKCNKERTVDIFKQECLQSILASPKGRLYQHLVDHFGIQSYLTKSIDVKFLNVST